MNANTANLLVSVGIATAALGAVDVAYDEYAHRHFLPNATLTDAESKGDGCVVTLGDSRMVAAIDPEELADGLRQGDTPLCVAPLALGALGPPGEAMELRRYLRDGRKPATVVLGDSAGGVLTEPFPDPAQLVGNEAAELAWSDVSDVHTLYPGFPLRQLDPGIRFLLARSNALQTYESATWVKVQALQQKVTGQVEVPRNRFGAIADMYSLRESFREHAMSALRRDDGHFVENHWFRMIRELTRAAGATLVVVELPMAPAYRIEVLESPEARRYVRWLRDALADNHAELVDLSATDMSDEAFDDGLHLSPSSARIFSRDLAGAIAPMLRAH